MDLIWTQNLMAGHKYEQSDTKSGFQEQNCR